MNTPNVVPLPCNNPHNLAVDCPAARGRSLPGLVGDCGESCRLQSVSIEPRDQIPPNWLGRFRFGVLRRGCLIRQRTDSQGRTTAVDVLGPGCAFWSDGAPGPMESSQSAYAVSRVLLCFSDVDTLERGVREGGETAYDVHELGRHAMQRMEMLADARGRNTALSKVAALLCVLSGGITPFTPERDTIPSGFLQRDLAALVSIRHESVCRSLRELEKRGLIEQSRDEMRLLDRMGLAAM